VVREGGRQWCVPDGALSGLAHGFGEPLVLLLWACCFSPGFWGLEVVDVMIFGEQHEWSITQVARMCASSVPPLGVLYSLRIDLDDARANLQNRPSVFPDRTDRPSLTPAVFPAPGSLTHPRLLRRRAVLLPHASPAPCCSPT
jgi:hypothetical protein